MKKKFLLVITVISSLAFQCGDKVEGGHEYITFVNNSESTVYVCRKPQMKIVPNDTLFNCNSIEYEVHSESSYLLEPTNNYWETDLKAGNLIMYFVYPQLTSLYGSCEEARKYQLKRYQLTKEDLDRMDWTITYP